RLLPRSGPGGGAEIEGNLRAARRGLQQRRSAARSDGTGGPASAGTFVRTARWGAGRCHGHRARFPPARCRGVDRRAGRIGSRCIADRPDRSADVRADPCNTKFLPRGECTRDRTRPRPGPSTPPRQGDRDRLMAIALANARVLSAQGWRDDAAVIVEDGRILELATRAPPNAEVHDLSGRILLPGFIDCQVNGGGGVLFNDQPTAEGIRAIGAAHRRFGTTGFLPTLISDTTEKMRTAIGAVDAAISEDVPGILGIHLEGPFLSRARRGVHAEKYLHAPDASELLLAESLRRGVTLLTLAPECVPGDAIRQLAEAGVIVSAGHSNADYATVRRALDAGVRGFTH